MKTFFAFTTGLFGGYVMTVVIEYLIVESNGKYKEFMDALTPDD